MQEWDGGVNDDDDGDGGECQQWRKWSGSPGRFADVRPVRRRGGRQPGEAHPAPPGGHGLHADSVRLSADDSEVSFDFFTE